MKFFLGVLAGLFILSRLQQGQGSLGIFAAAPSGGGGEIPYGGAAGIIDFHDGANYSGGTGGGGVIGSIAPPGGSTSTSSGGTGAAGYEYQRNLLARKSGGTFHLQ